MEKLFAPQSLPTPLTHLLHQAEAQKALLDKLAQQLPGFLQDALVSCTIQDHRLVITVANSALLNRLRLHQYQLLNTAQQERPELVDIHYQLTAKSSDLSPSTHQRRKPNINSTAHLSITQLSEQVTDHALSASLRALAAVLARQQS
jgi:hypothetical protein